MMMRMEEEEIKPEDDDITGDEQQPRRSPAPAYHHHRGRRKNAAGGTAVTRSSSLSLSLAKHSQFLQYVVSLWCKWPGKVLVPALQQQLRSDNLPSLASLSSKTRRPAAADQQQQQHQPQPAQMMMAVQQQPWWWWWSTPPHLQWPCRLLLAAAVAVGILGNVLAMAVLRSPASILAGIMALGLIPVVYVRQQKLQRLDTQLRQVQNQLRRHVGQLHQENNQLSQHLRQLDQQMDRLQTQEDQLRTLAARHGATVDQWIALVHENRTIMKSVKSTLQAELVQTLVHALIESDDDRSGDFSDDEIHHVLRMRIRHLPVGIIVNEELLTRTITASDRTLATVLALVQHIDMDDWPDQERVFRLDPSCFYE